MRDVDISGYVRRDSPNGGTTSVMGCLHVVLSEEWEHDRYANRDLERLEAEHR